MKSSYVLSALVLIAITYAAPAFAQNAYEEYANVKKGLFLNDNAGAPDMGELKGAPTENKSSQKSTMSIEQITAAYNEGKFVEIADAVRIKAGEDSTAAQKILAKMLIEGKGVDKNVKEAIRWLTSASDAGDTEAQFILGKALFENNEVDKDNISALKWLKIASLLETDPAKKATVGEEFSKVMAVANRREKTEAIEKISEWMNKKGKGDLLKRSSETDNTAPTPAQPTAEPVAPAIK